MRDVAAWSALILLPLAYLVGSEIYYAKMIYPEGVATVSDYFDRFGEPRRVQMVRRHGEEFYEFMGPLPPWFVLAHPSSPPAYVFDQRGLLTDWCRDPGDIPSHRAAWPLSGSDEVSVGSVRAQFGLP